ncbi:hypothetical protein L596_022479 [Steinernema carpocapsae]|uniref:Uncharacterized protein n=1 Tax=Steinernema carpocapsae TaxID=34508 RepID=A0A4U5MLU3_STECR|nr:hypothetical protein L596_022479 [Steinernema carpocapsae]
MSFLSFHAMKWSILCSSLISGTVMLLFSLTYLEPTIVLKVGIMPLNLILEQLFTPPSAKLLLLSRRKRLLLSSSPHESDPSQSLLAHERRPKYVKNDKTATKPIKCN